MRSAHPPATWPENACRTTVNPSAMNASTAASVSTRAACYAGRMHATELAGAKERQLGPRSGPVPDGGVCPNGLVVVGYSSDGSVFCSGGYWLLPRVGSWVAVVVG
jgi:hypothetical protein